MAWHGAEEVVEGVAEESRMVLKLVLLFRVTAKDAHRDRNKLSNSYYVLQFEHQQ